MGENREKFKKLLSNKQSDWLEKENWRIANKAWLDNSAKIAIKIGSALEIKNISQKSLAEKMGVTPQYVSKMLKGEENFTLETISKLETILSVNLIDVPFYKAAVEYKVIYNTDYNIEVLSSTQKLEKIDLQYRSVNIEKPYCNDYISKAS